MNFMSVISTKLRTIEDLGHTVSALFTVYPGKIVIHRGSLIILKYRRMRVQAFNRINEFHLVF